MISLALALRLKAAGVTWKPRNHDFFAIPGRGLDEQVFVLSDIQTFSDQLHGIPVVTFHGSSEWALDYLITTEAVWLPSGAQLVEILMAHNPEPSAPVQLTSSGGVHRCETRYRDTTVAFEDRHPDNAYAKVLLYILEAIALQ